jgi:hypothetical protein
MLVSCSCVDDSGLLECDAVSSVISQCPEAL